MEITLPSDCGNAPRIGVVGEFVESWAKGDAVALAYWLAEDVTWTLVGGETRKGAAVASEVQPPFVPARAVVLSIVTHGRLASCDGYLEADGQRLGFSHAIRFASTSKTAKIAEIRTYCVEAVKKCVTMCQV